MEAKLKKFNEQHSLKEKNLLLAVSGGVDSMVLLEAYRTLGYRFGVIHLNHGMRPESEQEAEYLKGYCRHNGIPFHYKKLKTAPRSEAGAREKRYQFFAQIKSKYKYDFVLTAHHLNDQVETFLLKLVRGAGPIDLWGMAQQNGFYLRPFLEIPKKELTAYAKKKKIKYFDDESNKDISIARNRIRIKVIPQLEKINPNFLGRVAQTLKLGTQEAEWVRGIIDQKKRQATTGNVLSLRKLAVLKSDFLKDAVLKKYLEDLKGAKEGVYAKNLEEITRLIGRMGEKKSAFAGVRLKKSYESLEPEIKIGKHSPKKIKLQLGNDVTFNGFQLKLSKQKRISGKNNILLPPELAYNLNIRTWQPGDKIKTRAGSKKLQDIFTDAKIGQDKRKAWPVVTLGREVIWVPKLAKSAKHLEKANDESFNLEVIDEGKKF